MQKRKRVMITLNAEPYERLRELTKALGWRDNWIGLELDKMVSGMLIVAEQAQRDAERKEQMTEAQARERYEGLMRIALEGK